MRTIDKGLQLAHVILLGKDQSTVVTINLDEYQFRFKFVCDDMLFIKPGHGGLAAFGDVLVFFVLDARKL